MKKTIIYSRVSTQMQTGDNNHSLDNQLSKLKDYCKLNGLANIIHLEDAGISGKNIKDRPAFKKMIELVKNNEVENVVVPALSRFARNVKDTLNTLELFKKYNIRFHSLNENIDTSTAIGKFLITIISALNQMEAEQISERISAVLQFRKSEGFCVGGIPLGKSKQADGKLVDNKQELYTLKIIKELTDQGLSIQKICNELVRRKRLNKANRISWRPCSVWRLQKKVF